MIRTINEDDRNDLSRSATPYPAEAPVRRLRTVLAGVALVTICGALYACHQEASGTRQAAVHATTRARLVEAAIHVDGRQRRFAYYVPARPVTGPPIVLAFHGSGGSGARLRGFMGGELERLADDRGFIAVYPEGFEGFWNGCRASAPSAANRLGIDDVAFVHALVAWLTRELEADSTRVYALGFSGGGHMAYRLALEIPERVPAIAVMAASLPVEDGLDCRPSGRPVSVMIVNGTTDPVNPYEGGEVVAPAGTRLGQVRSTRASARYFARVSGYDAEPATSITLEPHEESGTGVELTAWSGSTGTEVVLYTVRGGGHTIPGPRSRLPALVGVTEPRFAAVEEAVSFLFRQ